MIKDILSVLLFGRGTNLEVFKSTSRSNFLIQISLDEHRAR